MRSRDRPRLDDLSEAGTLLVVQDRNASGRFAGCKTIGAVRVEAQHPVAHDLQCDACNLGRITPASTVENQCHRQQTPNLTRVTASSRKPLQIV
jgi:hypothetical protein